MKTFFTIVVTEESESMAAADAILPEDLPNDPRTSGNGPTSSR